MELGKTTGYLKTVCEESKLQTSQMKHIYHLIKIPYHQDIQNNHKYKETI